MHTNDEYKDNVEEDYSDFYGSINEEEKNKKPEKDSGNKKILFIIIGLSILLIALIIILILVLKKDKLIEYSLSLENIEGDVWVKSDVTINVNVPDETNLKSIKYTINCKEKCDYVDVKDKKIVVSNSGLSNVTVVVTNTDNVENKKDIAVKIDTTNPTVTLSPNETNIVSDGPVTVCAMCTDNESGCKEEKVCKEYTKTSKSQTLTVEDKLGNKANSSTFSVTINGSSTSTPAANPSCSLNVNSTGLVTATSKNASYHGFSSSYSGNSENSKQLKLNNGESTTITYYVKNSEGKTATCSIKVKASCSCKFRGTDGKCYKTEVKVINDVNSSECANATRKTADRCYFYADEGTVCTYAKQ